MKRYLALVAAFSLACSLYAQDWGQVKNLYQAGMYSETLRLVQGNNTPMAEGYRALCALKLKTAHSHDIAKAFIARYHENLLVPQVRYQLGLDLFDQERYEEALQQFNQVSLKDIQETQRAEYTYKLGYCAFAQGEWDRAKGLLLRMKDLPYSDYSAPSYYTLGYINYAQKDFKEAAPWFELCAKDHRFSTLANYYILECRFNEKDYDYVLRFGEDLFNKVPEDRQPHLARIMSETYLIKGDVEKARSYYEKNLRNKAKLSRSDLFYAGEINYVIENWEGAVENFTRMENRTDSLGQIASYQLGYSYIQLRNKVAAMDAFKEASSLGFTPDIQEDALYNYAKLAFDLNRDTAPFQEYLQKYSAQKKGDQIYSYMAMVALQNHDYVGAVEAYDHIDELRPDMQANYMKAYFLRARELMESGSWRSAVPHLKAAAYYSPRREGFNQLARYYQAEALYRDGKYADARDILTDLYNLSALKNRPEGHIAALFLSFLSLTQILLEQLRHDGCLKVHVFIRVSQLGALITLIAVLVMLIIRRRPLLLRAGTSLSVLVFASLAVMYVEFVMDKPEYLPWLIVTLALTVISCGVMLWVWKQRKGILPAAVICAAAAALLIFFGSKDWEEAILDPVQDLIHSLLLCGMMALSLVTIGIAVGLNLKNTSLRPE